MMEGRRTVLMQVAEIRATCEANKPELKRTMSLVDRNSFGSYSHDYRLSMPAMDGIGTGDVLEIEISFKHNAAEDELIRAGEKEE